MCGYCYTVAIVGAEKAEQGAGRAMAPQNLSIMYNKPSFRCMSILSFKCVMSLLFISLPPQLKATGATTVSG